MTPRHAENYRRLIPYGVTPLLGRRRGLLPRFPTRNEVLYLPGPDPFTRVPVALVPHTVVCQSFKGGRKV